MTRWELIKAFRDLARILFVSEYTDPDEALKKVKEIVINVLTEDEEEAPKTFGTER